LATLIVWLLCLSKALLATFPVLWC